MTVSLIDRLTYPARPRGVGGGKTGLIYCIQNSTDKSATRYILAAIGSKAIRAVGIFRKKPGLGDPTTRSVADSRVLSIPFFGSGC
jgi:hypothetical protein